MTNNKKKPKTASLEEKRRRMEEVYVYWGKHKNLNMEQVCEACKVNEPALRAYIRAHKGGVRPDGIDRTKKSDRQHIIARAYEMALGEGKTAAEAAKWASEQNGARIGRNDIQHYAMKHDLPFLPETPNVQLFNSNKY